MVDAAAGALENGLLHKVAIDLPARSFIALRHSERHTGAAANVLLAMMKR